MPDKPNAPHTVYRMDFADGSSYVGITSRPVEDRIQEHLGLLYAAHLPWGFVPGLWSGQSREERLRDGRGHPEIMKRHAAEGYTWTWSVLASGLTHAEALDREAYEIARLPRPLNRLGVRRGCRIRGK